MERKKALAPDISATLEYLLDKDSLEAAETVEERRFLSGQIARKIEDDNYYQQASSRIECYTPQQLKEFRKNLNPFNSKG